MRSAFCNVIERRAPLAGDPTRFEHADGERIAAGLIFATSSSSSCAAARTRLNVQR